MTNVTRTAPTLLLLPVSSTITTSTNTQMPPLQPLPILLPISCDTTLLKIKPNCCQAAQTVVLHLHAFMKATTSTNVGPSTPNVAEQPLPTRIIMFVFPQLILVTTVTNSGDVLFQTGVLFSIENAKVECLFKFTNQVHQLNTIQAIFLATLRTFGLNNAVACRPKVTNMGYVYF